MPIAVKSSLKIEIREKRRRKMSPPYVGDKKYQGHSKKTEDLLDQGIGKPV